MSKSDFVVRFAGEGGEGVVTAAEMLARTVSSVGYHVLTYVTFPSQIMGGPTMSQVRISTSPVLSSGDELDVLVALNYENYEEHHADVRRGGVVVYDSTFEIPSNGRSLGVPLDEIAKKANEPRSKNMAVLGALAHLVNMPLEYLEGFLAQRFKGRDAVIAANKIAMRLGYEHAAASELSIGDLAPPIKPEYEQLLIKGNDALSLGALAAGVNFYAGYPISPASTILHFMERNLVGPGKFAYQVSSEIEAVNALLGGGYAGKKAMTATAGPGLSLMSEGIGLAWMAEIPLVIVDVQRGGPATGLPTKTEQSDLFKATHPAHGDVNIPVIAPGTVEECFYAAIAAFNWAERYQGPVIVLSEHMLSERTQNIPKFDMSRVSVENRKVYQGNGHNGVFLRYESAELAPMPIPGHPGSYAANGSEHDAYGDTTHRAQHHVRLTQRRFGKLKLLEDGTYESENAQEPIAIIPWGGSKGPSREAYNTLLEQGDKAAWYYTMFLNPLPPKLLAELRQKELVLVPELNYQGQFASILRSQGVRAEAITQYTGLPFRHKDLTEIFTQKLPAKGKRMVRA